MIISDEQEFAHAYCFSRQRRLERQQTRRFRDTEFAKVATVPVYPQELAYQNEYSIFSILRVLLVLIFFNVSIFNLLWYVLVLLAKNTRAYHQLRYKVYTGLRRLKTYKPANAWLKNLYVLAISLSPFYNQHSESAN